MEVKSNTARYDHPVRYKRQFLLVLSRKRNVIISRKRNVIMSVLGGSQSECYLELVYD